MSNPSEMTEVLIFTARHRITGLITLVPGARLTDFIRETTDFIAITQATVRHLDGTEIFNAPFLDLGRQSIEFILPKEMAHFPTV